MAGGLNWDLEMSRDNSEFYQKERSTDGFVAWFKRERIEYKISLQFLGYTPPNQLGEESGSVSFRVGTNLFSKMLASGKRFRCSMDEVTPVQKPLNYSKRTQEWTYIDTEERLTDWASPDDDDGGPFPPS